MKFRCFYIIILLFCNSYFGFSQEDRVGTYKYFGGYFEYTLTLDSDGSFTYYKVGDMIYERSYGTYEVIDDTLILNSSDTIFYDVEFRKDSLLRDSIRIEWNATETHAPFLGTINDTTFDLSHNLRFNNDTLTGSVKVSSSDFEFPLEIILYKFQRFPIILDRSYNQVSIIIWNSMYSFYDFDYEKWYFVEVDQLENSITKFDDEIFESDSSRNKYFKKVK